MRDFYSNLSSKGRAVIPKPVRQRLELKPGDILRFHVGAKAITLEKADAAEDDLFASFSEWTSDEDECLYGDL